MILLTDAEIAEIMVKTVRERTSIPSRHDVPKDLALAQARRVYEWGDERCADSNHNGWKLKRRWCSDCWLSTKKELGL